MFFIKIPPSIKVSLFWSSYFVPHFPIVLLAFIKNKSAMTFWISLRQFIIFQIGVPTEFRVIFSCLLPESNLNCHENICALFSLLSQSLLSIIWSFRSSFQNPFLLSWHWIDFATPNIFFILSIFRSFIYFDTCNFAMLFLRSQFF